MDQRNAAYERIEDTRVILETLGMDAERSNERSALVLLALLQLTPEKSWAEATNPMLGTKAIMDFIRDEYGRKYAPNTRETIRRFTLHQFVEVHLIEPNPDNPHRPVNSPKWNYQITAEALAMLADAHAGVDAQGTGATTEPDLGRRHVVVSAGGTREPLDPVRFLGNRSSGRLGTLIASAAARHGAAVTLVAANVGADVLSLLPAGVEVVTVGTALELEAAVRSACGDADAVIMTAAVADFRPAVVSGTKIKKHGLDAPGSSEAGHSTRPAPIELVENPDVLAGLVAQPPRADGGRTLVVGFAAETGDATGDVLAHGAAKTRRKGADLLAVNAVGDGVGFGDVDSAVVVLDREGEEVTRVSGSKGHIAEGLVNLIAARLA